jgi:hypothetical protein
VGQVLVFIDAYMHSCKGRDFGQYSLKVWARVEFVIIVMLIAFLDSRIRYKPLVVWVVFPDK